MSDDKLQRFTAPGTLATVERIGRLIEIPEYDFVDGFLNQNADATRLARAGGHVTTCSHGDGFRFYVEVWSFVIAGMTRLEALHAATLSGVRAIGGERDLGSLETGKLADFVVLEANPLDDIENTRHIRLVVKNGRVYDDENLDQVWPEMRRRPPSR